ncbi:hypothetical protein ACSBL2_06365 [Pedobacter sp. AW31-3R]|uniref:hypothetical protein n=1 Tax=Pedobacter sp. AW31-3R TaxID=3445781 RepID=UPI003FA035DD
MNWHSNRPDILSGLLLLSIGLSNEYDRTNVQSLRYHNGSVFGIPQDKDPVCSHIKVTYGLIFEIKQQRIV